MEVRDQGKGRYQGPFVSSFPLANITYANLASSREVSKRCVTVTHLMIMYSPFLKVRFAHVCTTPKSRYNKFHQTLQFFENAAVF